MFTRFCDSKLVTKAASRASVGEAVTMGLGWSRGEADGGIFWVVGGSLCVRSVGEKKNARIGPNRLTQDLYGSWKTWNVLEFCCGIFQDWIVLEKGYWSWKILEICLTQVKNMKCMADSKEN